MEDRIGIDFSSSGSVMTKKQLEEQRRKRGQCLRCGQKVLPEKTVQTNSFNGTWDGFKRTMSQVPTFGYYFE